MNTDPALLTNRSLGWDPNDFFYECPDCSIFHGFILAYSTGDEESDYAIINGHIDWHKRQTLPVQSVPRLPLPEQTEREEDTDDELDSLIHGAAMTGRTASCIAELQQQFREEDEQIANDAVFAELLSKMN
jgi:hypothetical protein